MASPWKLRLSNEDDKVMLIFERPPVNPLNCEHHAIKTSLQHASNFNVLKSPQSLGQRFVSVMNTVITLSRREEKGA